MRSFREEEDPETDLSIDETTGHVSGAVRIHDDCSECGIEARQHEFDVDLQLNLADHECGQPVFTIQSEQSSNEVELRPPNKRRQAKFHVVSLSVDVGCENCDWTDTTEVKFEVQVSAMEEV